MVLGLLGAHAVASSCLLRLNHEEARLCPTPVSFLVFVRHKALRAARSTGVLDSRCRAKVLLLVLLQAEHDLLTRCKLLEAENRVLRGQVRFGTLLGVPRCVMQYQLSSSELFLASAAIGCPYLVLCEVLSWYISAGG